MTTAHACKTSHHPSLSEEPFARIEMARAINTGASSTLMATYRAPGSSFSPSILQRLLVPSRIQQAKPTLGLWGIKS